MKRKKPALRDIGIDPDRRSIDDFRCGHEVELHHGCAHRFLAEFEFRGRGPVHADPPCLQATRRPARRYRHDCTDGDHVALPGIPCALPCQVMISGTRPTLAAGCSKAGARRGCRSPARPASPPGSSGSTSFPTACTGHRRPGATSPTARPSGGRRQAGEIGRDFGRLIGSGALSPQDEAALRSLIGLSDRLAATITAREGQIAGMAAQIAVLTSRIARTQREPCGSRSEKRAIAAASPPDGNPGTGAGERKGGRPGRKKARADAVDASGLRYNGQAPVIDITVTPPEIEGLAGDGYEVVSERVCCKPATLESRHVVIRYHYQKARIRESGALVNAPARESVFRNSCAEISFIAAMLAGSFARHLPLHRRHRMSAGARRAAGRAGPSRGCCRSMMRSGVRCRQAMSSGWTRRRSGPGGIRASPAA